MNPFLPTASGVARRLALTVTVAALPFATTAMANPGCGNIPPATFARLAAVPRPTPISNGDSPTLTELQESAPQPSAESTALSTSLGLATDLLNVYRLWLRRLATASP